MKRTEWIARVEARIEGQCACCQVVLVRNDGNGIVCGSCYSGLVVPMTQAERAAEVAAAKAIRSARGKAAAETRKLQNGSVSRNGQRFTPSFASQVAGERKYAEIRAKYSRSRGWM